jgi:hypothetical protein
MPEYLLRSLACRAGHVCRKNLLIIDFSSQPKDFRLEQVVLQEA